MKDIAKYKMCKMSRDEFMERGKYYTESFFSLFPDIYELVSEFWDKNQGKIKPFYANVRKDDDVIVTANVNILVGEIFARLNIKNYISTEFDMERGRLGEVCFSHAKVQKFTEKYGNHIDDFYTDSQNDAPLMALAKRVFMVKGNEITLIKQ